MSLRLELLSTHRPGVPAHEGMPRSRQPVSAHRHPPTAQAGSRRIGRNSWAIPSAGIGRTALPTILLLQPDIVRIAPAQFADGVANPKMNGFDGCNEVGCHRPVSTYLRVSAGPSRAMTRGTWHDRISLLINGIVRAHPPLQSHGKQQRQFAGRLEHDRGLHVYEICIP